MSSGQHSSSALETSSRVEDAANQNVDAIAGSDPGGIHASKPRSEPMTTHGHQPGVLATEADKAPEFSAQTLPAGTAPADRTFKPNPTDDVPLTQSNPDAGSTIQGSTSADVHTGLGHPGQGQTSAELRHDGSHTSKKQSAGLEGVGAKVENKLDSIDPRQRGLEDDRAAKASGTRGNVGGLAAQEREAESASTIAAENSGPARK